MSDITLRYLASNSLQHVIGDKLGLSKGMANAIIWKVMHRSADRANDFTRKSTGEEQQSNCRNLHEMAGIPGTLDTLDCIHVRVNVGRKREGCFIFANGIRQMTYMRYVTQITGSSLYTPSGPAAPTTLLFCSNAVSLGD